MVKFRSYLLGAAMTGAFLAASLGAARADVITLNPSNNNGGNATCTPTGSPCVIDAGQGAFPLATANIDDYAKISVDSTSGTGNFSEAGNFVLGNLAGSLLTSGLAAGSYYIYGTFTATGTGTWTNSVVHNTFNTTGISSFSFNLYADPITSTGLHLTLPTSSTSSTLAGLGVTQGTNDFLLATGTLLPTLLNTGTIQLTPPGCSGLNCALTNLEILLALHPVAGTTGPSGFFQSPFPFLINLDAVANATASNTNVTTDNSSLALNIGDCNGSITGNGCDYDPTGRFGSGTITFVKVPEPGSLALLGIGLLALGAVARRRVRRA